MILPVVLLLLGLALVGVNLVGHHRGLGLYPVSRQFPPGEEKLGRSRPIRDFSDLTLLPGEDPEACAVRLTMAVSGHMIHSMGSEFPRVSPFHNWILWALGLVAPSHFRFVEFRRARYALQRGFGLCSQSAAALADLLCRAGITSATVVFDGHVVVTAETAPGRSIVLDPDYGVALRMPLLELQSRAASVVAEAYSADYPPSVVERLQRVLSGPYEVSPRPCAAGRLRAAFERLAFGMKWAVPIALIAWGGRLALKGLE